MTHPFNGSSPSAPTEHLLFVNHYCRLLSTAWFSALLFPQRGGNSGTRSRNWTSSWLLAAHGTDIERSRTIWAQLTWTSQSCWITDGRLTLTQLPDVPIEESSDLRLHPTGSKSWCSLCKRKVKHDWIIFTDQLLDQKHWWVIGNGRFQSLSAYPEAKCDITESIDSWIRETSTRVLDLCSIA